MTKFPISHSAKSQKLDEDLLYIRFNVSNVYQAALLERRARKLYERNRWIPTRASQVQEILDIVREVRTQISAIVKPSTIADGEVHMKYHDILREGTRKLNLIHTRSESRIKSDTLEEENAIRLDQEANDEAVRKQTSLPATHAPSKVNVYKPDAPENDRIFTLTEHFSSYGEVEWHLHEGGFVLEPDLWRQLDVQHGFSEHGRIWDIPLCDQPIDSELLCAVSRKCRKFPYTLALAHRAGGEEVPVPLDVIPFYDMQTEDKLCCKPFCGSLRKHLQVRWPNQSVITAKSLKAPHIPSVLEAVFHASRFPPSTNSLYFLWKPIGAASTVP
ncbi:hypothetical protein M408DRAFT_333055 [Serendipita vermifera MAFF 305830]|uniref:Uncharacterized protein n=1 Tax=Serendipita vermifera MAFF 305830 TaxID=933852 RepID=A0A0C2WXX5_SERVB|nr:hypothetical protein M408DRAFT_333055 [Serendipita vermifera MAFF 305830]